MELEIVRWKPECSEQTLCLCGSQGRVQSLQPGGNEYDEYDNDDDDDGDVESIHICGAQELKSL